MDSVEGKYKYTSAIDGILFKDWAAGSRKQNDHDDHVISLVDGAYVGSFRRVRYAPAWLKIIDEPIVNALDHFVRTYDTADAVSLISVDFEADGRVRITNNGRGIEVVVHNEATAKICTKEDEKIWVPEFIFGVLFQGENFEKSDDSITGGTNGLGSKIANIFSTEFILETVDGERGLYYKQRWHNHMYDKEVPAIRRVAALRGKLPPERLVPHTTLSFMPDYKHFGYENETLSPSEYAELVDVVRTRVIYAAAYAHYSNTDKRQIAVKFNGDTINVRGIADLARILFPGADVMHTVIVPSDGTQKHPWELAVVVPDDTVDTHQRWTSIVNGIVVRGGKHFTHVSNQLVAAAKTAVARHLKDKTIKVTASMVSSNIIVLLNTKIPGAGWTGQRKDVLDVDTRVLSGYTVDDKFADKVAKKLRDTIAGHVLDKIKPKINDVAIYDSRKLRPAAYAGTRKASKCTLIATEGDGAKSQVEIGVANNKTLGFDYYGVISLGGVIVNARRQCSVFESADGTTRLKLSNKLSKNVFFNNFLRETGLNFNHKYDPNSSTYKQEIRELRYGRIVACVDQDYDGTGNIFGLLLNMFEFFWPNLLQAKFLLRFATPIQRAYPKRGGRVIDFYNDAEYDAWASSADVSKYNIQYYKGLGTHSREECIRMFAHFHDHLYAYPTDERSAELFEIYFGPESRKRKLELSTPVKPLDPAVVQRQIETREVSCSDQLEYYTKIYQKDSIERHLDHAVDGLNQSARMIFDGSRKYGNEKVKVAQLAGFISVTENYHHGESSLESSITGKAFIAIGGKQIPQLLPYGQFGTRMLGGKDAAPPRYIHTRFNARAMDIIYPPQDYPLLDFCFDEGKRGAPEYFVPIIPMAVIESAELPGHGWMMKTYGRDVFKVIDNVRRLIDLGENVRLLKMPPYTHGWTGEIRTIRGEPYSFGRYTYYSDDNVVHITELPLRVWTLDYVEKMKERPNYDNIVRVVRDRSDDRSVDITYHLHDGAFDWIKDRYGDSAFTDCFEEYFMLKESMAVHLNMVGAQHEVIEFESYEDIIKYWFPFRRDLYARRIERQITLLELKVQYARAVVRYIRESARLKLAKLSEAQMEAKLAHAQPPYEKIHLSLLNDPGFTRTEDLRKLIVGGPGASYDYLLNLSDKNKSREALDRREADLARLEDQLAELTRKSNEGRFLGAAIWHEELNKLEEVVRLGRETDWLFDEKNKFYY